MHSCNVLGCHGGCQLLVCSVKRRLESPVTLIPSNSIEILGYRVLGRKCANERCVTSEKIFQRRCAATGRDSTTHEDERHRDSSPTGHSLRSAVALGPPPRRTFRRTSPPSPHETSLR